MGSTQSTPESSYQQTNEIPQPLPISEKEKEQRPKKPKTKLTGFALVERKCRKKKRMYDTCSNKTHTAFVAGKEVDEGDNEASCDELFDIYKECIFLGMLKDRERRNVSAPKAESALADFKEDLEDE